MQTRGGWPRRTNGQEDTMRRLAITLGTLFAVSLLVGAPAAATAASDPVLMTFDKSTSGPGTWSGSVSGDVTGDLRTTLLSVTETGVIWQVKFEWFVEGDASFTAELDGTLNTATGHVVMNGRVVEGDFFGAVVHEEGQLIEPVTLHFGGLIRIMPATS
jgi:hypothetical protein